MTDYLKYIINSVFCFVIYWISIEHKYGFLIAIILIYIGVRLIGNVKARNAISLYRCLLWWDDKFHAWRMYMCKYVCMHAYVHMCMSRGYVCMVCVCVLFSLFIPFSCYFLSFINSKSIISRRLGMCDIWVSYLCC